MAASLESPTVPLGRSVRLLRVVQHVLFGSMVFVGVTRHLADAASPAAGVIAGAALLAWYVVGSHRRSLLPTPVWLAGLSVLCVAAVWVTPDYAWVSFAIFIVYASALKPAPAVASISTLAVTTGLVLTGRWPSDGHWAAQLIGPLVGASVAAALVGVYKVAAQEAAERQRLLEALLATREDLAAAHLEAGVRIERERLSREIHDTLAQGFTSVVLAARRARRGVDASDVEQVRREVEHIETLGREGVEQARRLVRQLPPLELEERALPQALESLARLRVDVDAGLKIDMRIDGEPFRLEADTELALLRVAQEAMTNAQRHAHARHIVLTLTYQSAAVSLDVFDDGDGFSPQPPPGRGFGLASMRSRVEQLGGRFDVESAAGRGTVITAVVPVGEKPWE